MVAVRRFGRKSYPAHNLLCRQTKIARGTRLDEKTRSRAVMGVDGFEGVVLGDVGCK